MKYKKYSYILLAILMLVVSINPIYARRKPAVSDDAGDNKQEKTCNYISENNEAMARLTIKWGYSVPWLHGGKAYSEVYFQKLGEKLDNDSETILNWYQNYNDSKTGITLDRIYKGSSEANKNPTCPTYIIMRSTDNFKSYGAFATNNKAMARDLTNASNQRGYKAWYLTYKNDDGSEITDEQYFKSFGYKDIDLGINPDAKITCSELFGDKNDENSLAYLIDQVLGYVRVIVPILIILLGTLDLAKAVIASKEDEIRKAQSIFIRRVLIGVAVFFIPLLVDVIMWLADIVWEGMGYTICEFK